MVEEKNRIFKTVSDFVQKAYDCDPETQAVELSQFSKLERENIAATEYIEAGVYPLGKFLQSNIKLSMRVDGKLYYPIVGWDPNTKSPFAEGTKVPPIRKWLNRLPKKHIHNSRENKTYILYG